MQISYRNLLFLSLLSFFSLTYLKADENSPEQLASVKNNVLTQEQASAGLINEEKMPEPAQLNTPSTDPELSALMAQISPSDLEKIQKEIETLCEGILKENLAQIEKIDWLLQECSNCISNNYAISKNKDLKLMVINDIRMAIDGIKSTPIIALDLQLPYAYTYICHSILKHLDSCIQANFDSLEPLDETKINIPELGPDFNPNQLKEVLQANETLLTNLEYKITNVGLYTYNKVYRSFKHYIIRPIIKYEVLPICGLATIAALGTGYLWWRLDSRSIEEIKTPIIGGILRKLRSIFKYPGSIANTQLRSDSPIEATLQTLEQPQEQITFLKNALNALVDSKKQDSLFSKMLSKKQGSVSEKEQIEAIQQALAETAKENALNSMKKPIGMLGRFEHFLWLYGTGHLPIGSYLLVPTTMVAGILLPAAKKKAGELIAKADNFLMGGAFKNNPVGDLQTEITIKEEDIIGMEQIKAWADEVVDYFMHPDSFLRAKIPAPKGALLAGPTRSGKSTAINLIYSRLKKAFGANVDLKLWNVNHRYILKNGFDGLFSLARENAPVILAIEEIDFFDLLRPSEQLMHLLTAMSSCMQNTPIDQAVIILATTNKPAQFDAALLTPGRFTDYFVFDYPTYQERLRFFEKELKKLSFNLQRFDIQKLVRETDGCSYENLDSIIKRSLLRSKIYHEPLSQASLELSLDQHVRRILGESPAIAENQRIMMATHLAGHVLVTEILESLTKVSKVTIKNIKAQIKEQPRSAQYDLTKQQALIEHGKIFTYSKYADTLPFAAEQELKKQITILAAGQAAEQLLLGTVSTYHMDNQDAITLAQSIVLRNVSLEKLSKHAQQEYLDKAYALTIECEKEAQEIVTAHKDELQKLAQELAQKEILDEQTIETIIFGKSTPVEEKQAAQPESSVAKVMCAAAA